MSVPGMFVTGTDTEVGKTWVTAALVAELGRRGHRVGAIKPVSTSGFRLDDGSLAAPDAMALQQAIGRDVPLERISPLVLEGEVAPSVAVKRSGQAIDASQILQVTRSAISWWQTQSDVILVEGVGGLLCPITRNFTVADLAVALDFPLLIVARPGLGTLNHTAMTIECARRRGLRVVGVVFNSVDNTVMSLAASTNPDELSDLVPDVPLLAQIPFDPDPDRLSRLLSVVDWSAIASNPRTAPVLSALPPDREATTPGG